MHYELYIDLLFLENFMMDSLLLLVLNRVLKCKSNWQRIFLGGGLGSGMMCLGIVVGIPGVFQLIFFSWNCQQLYAYNRSPYQNESSIYKGLHIIIPMCGFYGRHDDSIPAVFKVYQPFLWDGSGNGISLCEMLETVKKNKRKRTGAM